MNTFTVSLARQQYYAHPRNTFWKILALWDEIQCCERQGSLDSHITNASIVSNDFASFFAQHPHIKHIFFNGSRAYQDYHKRVMPQLAEQWQTLAGTRLPSTSPAMASLTFEQKLMVWAQIYSCCGR
jgi:hypoxanthine-DNA glycosylase